LKLKEVFEMLSSRQAFVVLAAVVAGYAATASALAAKRSFTIAAVEPKGGAAVDKGPFPAASLPEGGGFELKKPGADGRWQISAYLWSAQQIHVNKGDEVSLDFVGLNGSEHPTTIEGYDKSFTLKRGEVKNVSFVADKSGVFKIICSRHQPTMVSELIVHD
jgi:plastocyanin